MSNNSRLFYQIIKQIASNPGSLEAEGSIFLERVVHALTNTVVATYADLALLPKSQIMTTVKVTSDEQNNGATTVYQVWPDGSTKLISGSIAQQPINSTIAYFGDSITARGAGGGTGNVAYNNYGYSTFAHLLSNSYFFLPVGGNLGIGGNTTTQMLARLSTVLALKPKVVVILGGTNDAYASTSSSTIIGNLSAIYNACIGIGAKVVAITVTPRYDAVPAGFEATRLAVNAWIKSQSGRNIFVVDAESTMTGADKYVDNLHPNALGAYLLGSLVAKVLNTLGDPTIRISETAASEDTFTTNSGMTGNAGTLITATGVAATSWKLRSDGGGGATVVGSKSALNNMEQQLITVSGSYSGTGKNASMMQDLTIPGLTAGDIVESFMEFEIVSPLTNIISITNIAYVRDAGNAILNSGTGLAIADQSVDNPLPVGRYIMRTPAILIPNGNPPAIVSLYIIINFKDSVTSLPCAGVIRVYRAGVRKIEDFSARKSDIVITGKKVRRIADTAVTLANTDEEIAFISLTATRAITLGPASSFTMAVGGGKRSFFIKDETGTAGTNAITIVGTIDGVVNPTIINTAYGKYRFYTNGTAFFSE